MHFPAILRNYHGMTAYICRRFIPTTAILVSILLKEKHRMAGQLAAWHNHSGIFDQNGLLASDSCGDFRGGRTSLLLPPGAENASYATDYHTPTTTVLRPFFQDHPGEPVPEENLWTLWHKGRLTRQTHRLSGWVPLHPDRAVPTSIIPTFFTGQMLFLPPNQQCQSTGGNYCWLIFLKKSNCLLYKTVGDYLFLSCQRQLKMFKTVIAHGSRSCIFI